jgi:hypothetical protein
MSTLNVDLENLKPGTRYSFTIIDEPDTIVEGTFNRVIPAGNGKPAQYFFSNIVEYRPDPKPNNPNNKQKFKLGLVNYSTPDYYPQNIRVHVFNELPGDLNQMINAYGVKSKKNRKSKRRNRKSKKNRKSRRRRNKK